MHMEENESEPDISEDSFIFYSLTVYIHGCAIFWIIIDL